MGRRVKVAETKKEAAAEVDLVKELTGEIIRRAEENGWKRDELAKRAKKKSASTLYGWRNGTRKSPSLLDLQAFAQAVGLIVRLLPQDAVDRSGAVDGTHLRGVDNLKPETQEVVKWMEGLPEEARAAVKEAALAKVMELAARPPEAVADTSKGSRARSSK